MATLETAQLCVNLGARPILHSITASLVGAGEVVGLIGPNGSGKSTLLKAAAGLLSPNSGAVSLSGVGLREIAPQALAQQLAYLPQSPVCHWPLSVERVVELGLIPFAVRESERAERVAVALKDVDGDGLRGRGIDELSGGERARIFLARAVVGDPALLLIDEPGAGLDPYHQLQLMELIAARAAAGHGALVVLHDLGLAARFCHRLLLLNEGALVAAGSADEVLGDDALARTHRISVYRNTFERQPVIVPWRQVP